MVPPRRIVIIPIHNELRTLDRVLAHIDPLVDLMLLVDDGSTDGSADCLRDWQRRRPGTWILRHPRNRGMAQALKTGFIYAEQLLGTGMIQPDDILINVDADGQHPVEEIPAAAQRMLEEDLDVLLVVRDFSLYPRYKVLGNRFLSLLARLVSGFRYRDVESGFRFLRARCLPLLLPYFTGWKYSCAQEIAIITALQRLRIRNDYPVRINYYRPGTTLTDGFAVMLMSLVSFLRVRLGLRSRHDRRAARLASVQVQEPARPPEGSR